MGKTIFFSTHILADVAEICTRVGILEGGKLVAVGGLETLQQQIMPRRKIEITLLGSSEAATQLLTQVPTVSAVQVVGQQNEHTRLELEFSGDDAGLSQVLAGLVAAGVPVVHFTADSRDLEAVFLRATKGLVT
jgi:ABC-2 type transport system ATP-binding protein